MSKNSKKELAQAEVVESLMKRHSSLKGERSVWDSLWQDLAEYVQPRKAEITTQRGAPGYEREAFLFDSTAIRANQILANGQLSWMTPHEARWFGYEPTDELSGEDNVKQWYRRCSEIAQGLMARSNFYSEIHELYLDRGAFGTAVLYVQEGKRNPLLFQNWSVGSFSLCEDDEGLVDTCFRELKLSARQAEMMFGREALAEPMRKMLEKGDARECDVKYDFVHAVFPRGVDEFDPAKMDGRNMPIASMYIDCKHKHLCRESGYRELPFMATRYLKWGESVYGWSPSWVALPEAKQLNFLEKQMDALAEIAAFPRLLVPNTHEEDVDIRAGGVTYFDPNTPSAIPREWITQGRYDVGLDRANRKQKAIESAFHVDLFQMFAGLDKQMTAREVSERSSEKLTQFSPTFARMTTELFNPLLNRVFSILLRGGHFPPPPQEALVRTREGAFLPEPRVVYSSRIALAIKSLENNAFMRTMELVGPLAQSRPDIMDNYDLDRIVRDMSRNDGMPAEWMLPFDAVEEMREARAQQAAQQQQMMQAAQMADAAGKMGKIPPDSPIGQQLSEQMGMQ